VKEEPFGYLIFQLTPFSSSSSGNSSSKKGGKDGKSIKTRGEEKLMSSSFCVFLGVIRVEKKRSFVTPQLASLSLS
jgi:hypothetical protein